MSVRVTVFIEREEPDGFYVDEIEAVFPSHVEVCGRCNGRGTHDAWEGGMTAAEMHEQGPDFFEDYMAGHYDVVCTECKGRNVVEVIDRDRADPVLLAAYDRQQREDAEIDAMYAAERRMGA